MLALEIASQILNSIKRSWSDAAVAVIERERSLVKVWDGEPAVIQRWSTVDSYLRLGLEGRLFIIELATSDPRKIAEEAGRLERIAKKIEPSDLYSPLPSPDVPSMHQSCADRRIAEYLQNPVRLLEEPISEAMSAGGERVSGTLTLEVTNRALATTTGFEGTEDRSSLGLHLRAFKDSSSGHWSFGSSNIDEGALKEVGRKAGEIADLSKKIADFSPGKYDVVLSPMVMGNLANVLAMMSSALASMIGYSFLAKYKPGDEVASEAFSFYDRPRDPSLPGSASFDDEGVETWDKAVIERGKLVTLLHNTATASKFGSKSTGNAGWMMPRAWNLEISQGDLKEEELAEELKNGIMVMNNWYTRLQNYVEGQFSTVSRDAALLVRNGEIIGNVGRVRVASSFPRLLSSIEQMTRERNNVWWWEVEIPTRAPFSLIRGVEITRPEV